MDKNCPSVAAVIVAFSRLELLQQSIDALRTQARRPDEIIIIDQSSQECIHTWLSLQDDLTVLRQPNIGSAGGFGTGLRLAVAGGHDWIWILDDDGIARPDALEQLVSCPYLGAEDTAYLVSRVVDRHGRSQQVPVLTSGRDWFDTVLADHCVKTGLASWLGLLVSARAVLRHGLPLREFFIWQDDLEYTDRITRDMKGYCVLTSIIVHMQQERPFDPFRPADFVKIAHGIRNEIGWIKVSNASLAKKAFRILRAVARCLGQVCRRELPLKSLLWLGNGIFLLWPRIERIDPPSVTAQIRRPNSSSPTAPGGRELVPGD